MTDTAALSHSAGAHKPWDLDYAYTMVNVVVSKNAPMIGPDRTEENVQCRENGIEVGVHRSAILVIHEKQSDFQRRLHCE